MASLSDHQKFIVKTEGVNDVIWASSVELTQLEQEECFPIIGDCQVSSILSNLDTTELEKTSQTNSDVVPQTMDLIVLQNTDYKITTQSDLCHEIPGDFIFLKDNEEKQSKTNDVKLTATNSKIVEKTDDDFENMLYFVCNLCPYLCIKDSKITEHLELVHKTKACGTTPKQLQLKCPACPNIFYHKIPLRSHLIHDHKVGSSDLRRIIQAVIYFSKKTSNNSAKLSNNVDASDEDKLGTPSSDNCKNEVDLKYIEKLIGVEKIISNDDDMLMHDVVAETDSMEAAVEKEKDNELLPETVSLPLIDITHNDAEKTFRNIIKKKPDTLIKYLDQKKFNKCTISMCKVRLQDVSKMVYHTQCHAEGTYKCPECNEMFAFWKPLTGHLWRTHKIDMELFACDKCDYKTFSLGKLNNIHKLIHSDLKPFACEVCLKAFKNTKQLRNHKATHKEKSDKLSQVCEICNKVLSDRRQLRVHMDGVHKKIKPFLCNYCGYKGASKSALKMHIRQHTGEKPFACNSCEYTTSDHNSLRRHKLRHSGYKPYKCAHCVYACIQSSTYKVHLRTKHPGLEKDFLFTCPECQFRTINQDIYLSHLVLIHRQKDN